MILHKKVQRLVIITYLILRKREIFMKHIVYLTINKINFKIYIGIHSTENPNE